jgi:sugar lactone lactonase YvrE
MKISLKDVQTIGSGIVRPEGVMALSDGTLYTADGRGHCARIRRTGKTDLFGNVGGLPNGICVDAQGACIVANLGNGQVQRLFSDGRHEVLAEEADGQRIRTPNFPLVDSRGRIWVSNSTARSDVDEALRHPAPDGGIVLLEKGSARIVADRIYFANGLAMDDEERHLYVAETLLRRILRFRIDWDGSLSGREVYGPWVLAPQGFPDGIAFDEAGNLWITFPVWNAVGFLTRQRELEVALEDPERRVLKTPSNICFGWEERRTAFIGSLDGTAVPYFRVPYPGAPLVHQKDGS